MIYRTVAQLETEIRSELDLTDETIVTSGDIMVFINEAIDAAEAEIQGEHQDYFLTRGTITVTAATAEYDLATLLPLLYAGKIRGIVYRNGDDIYEVKRLKGRRLFESYQRILASDTSGRYRYNIWNDTATAGYLFEIVPPPRDSGAFFKVFYIRNAKRVTATSDSIDIPEFFTFIKAFAKWKAAFSEGHPQTKDLEDDVSTWRKEMIDTLASMAEDGDNEVEMDLDFYEDFT